ncbi:MAG TPA: diguanylate cyclase [Steroidobacteraceae bacterium]|nr:diguanylate cyclase [Steroidobacteraceae bacterium]
MLRMDPSSLRRAAEQLKRTTEEHAAWHEDVLRSIFCDDFTAQDSVLASAAHRDCSFGRWFYEEAPNGLRDQPAFVAIGKEHQRLHQVAARMLRAARAGAPVARPDFEDLVGTSARLRVQIDYLRSSIDAALGNRDPLTGALGRIAMLPDLHELRAGIEHGGQACSLVFMDVDELKRINDEHGHGVGDAVLCGVVAHVQEHLRAQDRVYRYGGDEFLLALPGADLEVACAVASRVRDGLVDKLFVAGPGGAALHVTASFGLALLDPDEPIPESINRADQALLLAKTAGRNRVIKWDAAITTSTRWRRIDVEEPR